MLCVELRHSAAPHVTARYRALPHGTTRRRMSMHIDAFAPCALRYIAVPHGAVRFHAAQHGTASGVNVPLTWLYVSLKTFIRHDTK